MLQEIDNNKINVTGVVPGIDSQSPVLIYDDDCPFCARFVRYARLRDTIGEVKLVSARDDCPEVQLAKNQGYNLNEGMLLYLNGQVYFGADCLNMVALLSSRSDIFNRLNYMLFRNKYLARFAYPVLKFGRRITLLILGVSTLK